MAKTPGKTAAPGNRMARSRKKNLEEGGSNLSGPLDKAHTEMLQEIQDHLEETGAEESSKIAAVRYSIETTHKKITDEE